MKGSCWRARCPCGPRHQPFTILSTMAVQVQSNALAALEALDKDVAEEILSTGCVTGDRINGLCDGETGKWCAMITAPVFCQPEKFPFQKPHPCF